ncbi:MAG: hypothetical protein ACXWQ6_05020 [Candidatus Limnocylindrales bacterium]
MTVTVADSRAAFIHPILPPDPPGALPLQASLLTSWSANGPTPDTMFTLVYGSASTTGLSITGILNAGGWIVAEGAASGRDASAVKRALDAVGASGAYSALLVGPYEAALVRQNASAGSPRPYHLYWSDGVHDMSVQAAAPSSEVIDFARSFYCG